MTVDPNIQKKANDIRTKTYGKEVRESLASGLEEMSKDVEETKGRQDEVESQFQSVIDNTTGKDVVSAPEILAARVSADGTNHANLKERLDKEHQEVTSQLAQRVPFNYFNTIIQSLADGGPRDLFYSIEALKTAFPNGELGTYLVVDSSFTDGAHSFIWDGTQWVDLGVYHSTGLDSILTVENAPWEV